MQNAISETMEKARKSLLLIDALVEKQKRLAQLAETAADVKITVRGEISTGRHEKYVLEMMDNHQKVKQEIKGLVEQRKDVESMISLLDDERHVAVLTYRYLVGIDWTEIAEKMGYTERWVMKLHDQAIREIERIEAT